MLLSHEKKFIYFKTKKTASTSIEIYFEPYCTGQPDHIPAQSTKQIISSSGIIGSRRDGKTSDDMFFNHMPAIFLLERIGLRTFNRYFKFCNMRNPFDKMVSRFWWVISKRGVTRASTESSFDQVRSSFNQYIIRSPAKLLANDRPTYFIGPEAVADFYIRYEHLNDDLSAACDRLGIPYDVERLGTYNRQSRTLNEPFSSYYDHEAADKVARIFAWEIAQFGYRLSK